MNNQWRRLNGEPISDIISETETIILRELAEGNRIKICIGTDSQWHAALVEFATAIVFLREKRGGFLLVRKEVLSYKGGLKQRMLDEVSRSIEIAYQLCPMLERYDIPMEVHADINQDPHFMSNVALKEAMGYILGMGFQFKAKPDAFASSSCANKVVQ
ncbi:MAG: hypothetical protein JNL57_02260 [Bacteroidetes bacterium]|nr:hypothetical protein [Bacteroidota bacterium]